MAYRKDKHVDSHMRVRRRDLTLCTFTQQTQKWQMTVKVSHCNKQNSRMSVPTRSNWNANVTYIWTSHFVGNYIWPIHSKNNLAHLRDLFYVYIRRTVLGCAPHADDKGEGRSSLRYAPWAISLTGWSDLPNVSLFLALLQLQLFSQWLQGIRLALSEELTLGVCVLSYLSPQGPAGAHRPAR